MASDCIHYDDDDYYGLGVNVPAAVGHYESGGH
jgi:hypothetical protein